MSIFHDIIDSDFLDIIMSIQNMNYILTIEK
jgi:hypothetical protein